MTYEIMAPVNVRFDLNDYGEFIWWRKIDREGKTIEGPDLLNYEFTPEEEEENRTFFENRAKQAGAAGKVIFEEIFQDPEETVWVMVNDFGDRDENNHDNGDVKNTYIRTLFPDNAVFEEREVQSMLKSRLMDEEWESQYEYTQWFWKGPVKDLQYPELLQAIANQDNGVFPKIYQTVLFIVPNRDLVFYMYDDRGCQVFSDEAEKLRWLYEKYNDWIVDYHRAEIDAFFQ